MRRSRRHRISQDGRQRPFCLLHLTAASEVSLERRLGYSGYGAYEAIDKGREDIALNDRSHSSKDGQCSRFRERIIKWR